EVLAGAAVELPEDAGLADREQRLLAADIDEHALVDLVEVERLAGRMLEVPLERAGVGIQRERRARVERAVERGVAAARGHPRLRLRDAPVGRVEIGIVGPGNPRVAAGAVIVLHVAPGVGAALSSGRDRAEPPELVPVLRVVRADEALLFAVARA